MKCISSPALDDAQIMSYVEGEGDDAVASHIRECPYCRERAEQWTHLQNRLQQKLYRVSCPTPMELGDYHLGLLPAPQVLVIAQHLRECPLCRREVAELEEFLTDPAQRPSIFRAVKVLVARLLNQAQNGHAPAGVALRGEGKGPLTFEAEGVVITLDVQQEPSGQVSILGQLAADDQDQWTGAKVELEHADSTQLTSSIDDLGAFRFDKIAPSPIQITIKSLYNLQIRIPNIDIAV
ncbi:MAG TPA: hypothetical protein VK897_19775 [Anaerolineales bacterium]|nr:hypothetical protein [Anaerolineales bacterium]